LFKPEILAPAGSPESFAAALNAGADAVYLGMNVFNARMKAANFNLDNIAGYIRQAHLFGMRVFITLNTLLFADELPKALDMVERLWELGADAFILQDLGLATKIKELNSEIVIHASTQMGINNLEGALVLERLGFSRVILARETPISEIKRIHAGCSLQIECFVHGALCVAYSGNCYFSSLVTGNSGNRGECLQFCRRKYVSNGESGYFLSAKDICLVNHIEELKNAGVTSFKIEGRLRSPAYVASAVKLYKKAIEPDYRFLESHLNEVKQSFNRGNYSCGYFGTESGIIDNRLQGHLGLEVGVVERVITENSLVRRVGSSGVPLHGGVKPASAHTASLRPQANCTAIIKSAHQFLAADGVKFVRDGYEIGGMGCGTFKNVRENTYEVKTKTKLECGDKVQLTLNSSAETATSKARRLLDISGEFWGYGNKCLKLKLKAGEVQVVLESDIRAGMAINAPTTEEQIREKLTKLNETDFSLSNLKINLQDNVFIPASALNNLRRDAVARLVLEAHLQYLKSREKGRQVSVEINQLNLNDNNTQDNRVSLSNLNDTRSLIDISQLTIGDNSVMDSSHIVNLEARDDGSVNLADTNPSSSNPIALKIDSESKLSSTELNKVQILIFNPCEYSHKAFEQFFSALAPLKFKGSVYLDMPIIVDENVIATINEYIAKYKLGVFANNYYAIELANRLGVKLMLGFNLNILNAYSLKGINNISKVSSYCYSAELSLISIRNDFSMMQAGFVYAYGNFPLMYLKHCPLKENFGRKCSSCGGMSKLVYTDERGEEFVLKRNKIGACSFELLNGHAINLLDKIQELKGLGLMLDLTNVSAAEAKDVITAFVENRSELLPKQKYTHGLLFRKVK